MHFNDANARVLARVHVRAGQMAELQVLAEYALQNMPRELDWLSWLAYSFSMQQKPEPASLLYLKLTQLQPQNPLHWCNLGNSLCELGQEVEALEPLQTAYQLGARNAAVFFALARSQTAHGELTEALNNIDLAIKLEPKDTEFRILRARLLAALDEWPLANAEIDAILNQDLNLQQKTEIGYVLLRGGFYLDALHAFESDKNNLQSDLDNALGLILTLERLNRLEQANTLRESLSDMIDNLEDQGLLEKVWQVDAKLASREKDFSAAAELLQKILSKPIFDKALAYSLKFDLAAAYDKCGTIDDAMGVLVEAHADKRGFVHQHHPSLIREDGLLGVLHQAPAVPNLQYHGVLGSDQNIDPVFVVGFPRSGTTLLEQLLDAHTGLSSFDEQPFLQRRLQKLVAKQGRLDQAIAHVNQEQVLQLRAEYFQDVGKILKLDSSLRCVDKNPLNMVRLALAETLFPHSKIILALRHPCDVVLSCYMQNFRALAFTVTFESIESTAQMYDQVFNYWLKQQASLKLPVHIVRYEDLVTDVEPQAKRIFEFLKLPWQDNLLEFTDRAKTKGAISTPSYTQVIEGVNQRAIGRWRPYREYFSDKAMDSLMPWIELFGYSKL